MISSRHKSSTWLAGCLVVAVCLLIGAAIGSLAGYVVAVGLAPQLQSVSNPAEPDPTGLMVSTPPGQTIEAGQQPVVITDQSSSVAAVSQVLPAVVTVIAQGQQGLGGGSGFFISSEGYVVTYAGGLNNPRPGGLGSFRRRMSPL